MFHSMFVTTLQLAFAGVWQFIFHWGLGIGLIVCLLAAAYFTTAIPIIGPYLTNARKDLLWAAFGVSIFLAGHVIGVKDEANRNNIKTAVIDKKVDTVVKDTMSPAARARLDRWDRKEY